MISLICLLLFLSQVYYQPKTVKRGLFVLSQPVLVIDKYVLKGGRYIQYLFISNKKHIDKINKLRADKLAQSVQIHRLQHLQIENRQLKDFLGYQKQHELFTHTAKVESINHDRNTFWIDQGSSQKLKQGMLVYDGYGVAGRIVDTYDNHSEVWSIAHPENGIPVMDKRSGVNAIAQGTGSVEHLKLLHVPRTADVTNNDVFVTSGMGGELPKGVPVGTVVSSTKQPGHDFLQVNIRIEARTTRLNQLLVIGKAQGDQHG